jgi:SAM-dependent methyltransferase
MGTYVFDQAWQDERRRHEGIARLWDAGTFELLKRLGVGPGWRCVEIGAGAGSVARWLSERVGPEGHVLATDLDPRLLEGFGAPNVEVRALDVLADELPAGTFDLVYARLLLEHVGVRALRGMLPALCPGALLVIEDYDCALLVSHLPDDVEELVNGAILDVMSKAGFDPYFGRKAAAELIAAGLTDVGAEGRACVVRGGTPDVDFARLTLLALRAAMLEAGSVSDADCDATLARYGDPAWFRVVPLMVAAWGRAPA